MLTWAEINLDAISHNLRQIKSLVEPKGAKVLAVVKDNAYGHGVLEVAHIAESENVSMFGVATVEEAIHLQRAGIKKPILVFCCILPEQTDDVVHYDITQTVSDLNISHALSESAKKLGKKAKIHIKVDTGMGRIGVACDKAVDMIKQIIQLPNIIVDGVYTHFSVADEDKCYTDTQIERFNSVLSELKEQNINIPIRHSANSAAILNFPSSYYDMVRPGIAIYGLPPCDKHCYPIDLRPALSLKTRLVYLKSLPIGSSISYGRTYTTDKPSLIATIAVGYGHGYDRRLSNKAEVLIMGKRARITGTICMDQCLCDVTHIPEASIGDEVVLIGKQGNQEITADELANKVGTISYEILCGINANVKRKYIIKGS
jgi:alanine racemase